MELESGGKGGGGAHTVPLFLSPLSGLGASPSPSPSPLLLCATVADLSPFLGGRRSVRAGCGVGARLSGLELESVDGEVASFPAFPFLLRCGGRDGWAWTTKGLRGERKRESPMPIPHTTASPPPPAPTSPFSLLSAYVFARLLPQRREQTFGRLSGVRGEWAEGRRGSRDATTRRHGYCTTHPCPHLCL